MPIVGTDTISNTEIEIHATASGTWQIYEKGHGGERDYQLSYGATMEQAIQRARTELGKRKVKVAIPFFTASGQRGVATGIHGRTGKVLTRVGRPAKAEQMDTYVAVLKGDTPKEVRDRINELDKIQMDARREREKIFREHSMHLGNVVKKAVEEEAKDAAQSA